MSVLTRMRTALAKAIAPKVQKRTAFAGAGFGRLTSDWIMASTRSADAELRADLRTLRNRSRELVRNSPLAFRYQQLIAENVIGPYGIRLKPTNVLKRSGDLHGDANTSIKEAWLAWSKPGVCDVTQKLSLTELLSLSVSNWGTDGEILIRILRGPQFGPFGIQLQLVDLDLLDDQLNQERMGTTPLIRQGVEFNEWGAPVAYWLYTRHPNDAAVDRARVRVPASDIIHAFIPTRPGQSRGIPHAAAIMASLKMLDGYVEAELVAARTASASMASIEDIPNGESPAVNPNAANDDGTGGRDIPLEVEPGAMLDLRGMNARLATWDPTHPTTAFPAFTTKLSQFIAIGYGISYGTLTGDLSQANYGSLRVGMLDERDHWKRYQSFIIEHVLDRIYDAWLPMALLNSQIAGVREYDAARWNKRTWRPRGFDWIDPLKDVQGELIEVAAGVKTLTRMAADRGDDLEELLKERAEELALFAKYNVPSTLATSITDHPTDTATNQGAADSTDSTATADANAKSWTGALPVRSLPVRPLRAVNG